MACLDLACLIYLCLVLWHIMDILLVHFPCVLALMGLVESVLVTKEAQAKEKRLSIKGNHAGTHFLNLDVQTFSFLSAFHACCAYFLKTCYQFALQHQHHSNKYWWTS